MAKFKLGDKVRVVCVKSPETGEKHTSYDTIKSSYGTLYANLICKKEICEIVEVMKHRNRYDYIISSDLIGKLSFYEEELELVTKSWKEKIGD